MSRLAFVTPDDPPEGFICRGILVPLGQSWQAILTGQLYALTLESSFEQVAGLTPGQAAAVFSQMFQFWDQGVCPMFAGMIVLAARSSTPGDSWLPCDGEAYLIDQYPDLFNAIGDLFGDNGAGTFRVPDLRDNFPVGAGQVYNLADAGGETEHTLTTDEIPAHSHQFDLVLTGSPDIIGIPLTGNPEGDVGDVSTKQTGGGQAHNNLPPYLALNFFIYAGA